MVDNYIKKKRIEKGLTQKDLANKLNVTQGQISQWEHSRTIRVSTLERIAAVLECDATELISVATLIDMELSDEDIARIQEAAKSENRRVPTSEELKNPQPVANDYSDAWNEDELLESFFQLNDMGKHEAIKRVEELTLIKKYTEK